MVDTVRLADASPIQLRALLGLSQGEAERLAEEGPTLGWAELDWLPQSARRRINTQLEIEKRNLNEATVAELVECCGLSSEAANGILAGRPYFVTMELRHIAGVDAKAFAAITDIFSVPPLAYADKLSGRQIALRADSGCFLVRLKNKDTESAESFAQRTNLRRLSGGIGRSPYQVFAVPESETGTARIRQLRSDGAVDRVIPAFRNAEGERQFVDPEFCVVQFEQDVSPEEQEEIAAAAGLVVAERHRTPGLITLRLRETADAPTRIFEAVAALNASNGVAFAEPGFIAVDDREGARKLERADDALVQTESAVLDWNLAALGCAEAWGMGTGSEDVVIAVVDTGVDSNHPALVGGCLRRGDTESWNFEDDADPDPTDIDGHGTFIAGLLVGNGAAGIRGISPGCRVLPLRVPLTGVTLSYARRRDALLYAVARVLPPRRLIINVSWKTTGDVALIRDAIDQAERAGALVVCSAGNWPMRFNEPHYPSDYDQAVSVAALGPGNAVANYSFLGDRIDLCAPGGAGVAQEANIRSAALGGAIHHDFGTSFAAPHVAGAAALLLSHRPHLDSASARHLLEETAVGLGTQGTGRGAVRVDLALVAATESSGELPVGDDTHTVNGLVALNEWSADALQGTFGLLPITARIIVARRPFAEIGEVRPILGLSEVQYQRILEFGGSLRLHRPSPGPAGGDGR